MFILSDPFWMAMAGLGLMFLLIALHVPIGISMGLTGVLGCAYYVGWDSAMSLLEIEVSGIIANDQLALVAIFLLMGSFANIGGLAGDIYRLAYALVGHWRGGLAMATVAACGGFGAVCGSSVATTAAMGRIAMPEMLERKYDPSFAAGVIASSGTLGILIPPSSLMILYAVLTEQYILALFSAALLPGLLTIAYYFIAVATYVTVSPGSAPRGALITWPERWAIILGAWRVVLVAGVVSVGLYSGIFTVSETASIGAGLTLLLAVERNRMSFNEFLNCLLEAAGSTCLIFVIVIGAHIFSYFISITTAPEIIVGMIKDAGIAPLTVILLLMIMYIILGSIFDTVASMVITLPFVFPLMMEMGYHPVWWGIIMVVVMEIGLITPPIGINVFVLHSVVKDMSLGQIYRGIFPFFIADLVRLATLVFFPAISLYLPGLWGFI
jgi:C4-dicarboxylate transporter, DctM subunit